LTTGANHGEIQGTHCNFIAKTRIIMKVFPHKSLLAALVLGLGLAHSALAQYVWIDDKGVKQFSDQPPPASIPKKNILKGPQAKSAAKPGSDEASAEAGNGQASDNQASAPPAAPTYAERNADFKKRQQEQAEKDKLAASEAARAAGKKKNCELARDYQRTLDSGIRITNTDKKGERVVMSDEERNRATRENREILDGCK
jgi:pyruvate/2-oxoglutarate dehydrogenase complex dihydrolipoamide acyltransferase (E2) component